jgi:hypothetical protein
MRRKSMTWNELKQKLESGNHHYDPDALEQSPLGLKRYAAIARDYRRRNAGRTRDIAIDFRVGAGFAGAVNRTHPASIEPVLIDYNSPPLYYGQGVVIDPTTEGVRPLVAGDSGLSDVYGITVRPYPFSQTASSTAYSASIGAATPPIAGLMDVLKFGYISIPFNNVDNAPVKGGPAFIWVAATSGAHIQGLWEATDSGSAIQVGTVPRTVYQGGWDANYVGELIFHA